MERETICKEYEKAYKNYGKLKEHYQQSLYKSEKKHKNLTKDDKFVHFEEIEETEIDNIKNEWKKLLKSVKKSGKEVQDFTSRACEDRTKFVEDREKFQQLIDGITSICYKTFNEKEKHEPYPEKTDEEREDFQQSTFLENSAYDVLDFTNTVDTIPTSKKVYMPKRNITNRVILRMYNKNCRGNCNRFC